MIEKSVGEKVLYPELSYSLIKIAFEIHNTLGPGFSENIYEAAFIQELRRNNIFAEEQKPILVKYKGVVLGEYRLDLVIENIIVLELKAVAGINEIFK